MKEATLMLESTTAMLMHSDKLANPLHPLSIEIGKLTKLKPKTREVYEEIAWLQWKAALYLNGSNRIVMPSANIRKSLIEGGRFHRRGKDVERGVFLLPPNGEEWVAFNYDGPKNYNKLYEKREFVDMRSVVISRRRVMACRPRFLAWSCECPIIYDDTIIDENGLSIAFENAGQLCGLGTYRPLFGRYKGLVV